MKTNFFEVIYDENRIIDEVREVADSLDFYKKNNIKYYFPFSSRNPSNEDIEQQNEAEKQRNKPAVVLQEIQSFFSNHEAQISDYLERYDPKLKLKRTYYIYLSYYGCDGYYYSPNAVVVNIHGKKVEYILETIIHELVHLLVEDEEYSQKNEVEVDDIFMYSGLTNILPRYKRQIFHE